MKRICPVRARTVTAPTWRSVICMGSFRGQRGTGMEILERTDGKVTVLDLSGKVTLGEGDVLLKDKLHSLLNQGRKDVLLNLAQVSYVDSAGLGAIVSAYTTMTREGGSLKLANVTKKLQDLLSITKLLTVFETFDSEDEALRSYR